MTAARCLETCGRILNRVIQSLGDFVEIGLLLGVDDHRILVDYPCTEPVGHRQKPGLRQGDIHGCRDLDPRSAGALAQTVIIITRSCRRTSLAVVPKPPTRAA